MDITKAFEVNSLTVYDFFTRGRTGYNIPQYQRPYSWDAENVDQLMDDICSGMFDVLNNENEIHFMGTVITVVDEDFDRREPDPLRKRAHPTRTENIIDGQQRISTISVLACCLYQSLKEIDDKLPDQEEYDSLKEATLNYLSSLYNLFSYNLETRGNPPRKPILIREGEDEWILDSTEKVSYKSEVTGFLADFIESADTDTGFPNVQSPSQLSDNIDKIQQWLEEVKTAHTFSEGNVFPSAYQIIQKINQKEFWDYPRTEDGTSIVDSVNAKNNEVCTLIQLLGFSYYLLKCCCFTSIVPTSEVRAFDMFQSLNATGTPLTALETFKPLVINFVQLQGSDFSDSVVKDNFSKVENLFEKLRSASSKNQRTNEYLTLLAQTYEGEKLARQFSKQRSWLTKAFEASQDKENFVRKMSDIAVYSKQFIYSTSPTSISSAIAGTVGQDIAQSKDTQEASLCLLYLIDAKHKMAHTILSRFYSVARNSSSSFEKRDFLLSCKSVSAFFTLWRSALIRKYPDSEYRKILQNEMCWSEDRSFTVDELNRRFRAVLEGYDISIKSDWVDKASQNLRYSTSKALCKFVLFISSQDTIPDPNRLGLMTTGTQNSTSNYLGSSQWISSNLETIEHVAPQERTAEWDLNIYEDESYDKIGNLTLLPSKVNTSASNKGWIEKYIYYRYLSEINPSNAENLRQVAIDSGVTLSESTMKFLGESSFHHHILPIVQLGTDGTWDKNFIYERSRRICEVVWDKLYSWLE